MMAESKSKLSNLEDVEDDVDVEDDADVEEEESVQYGRTLDLFSQRTFDTPESCILFCKNHHEFDLELLKKRHELDQLSYVRLINFVRAERPSAQTVMTAADAEMWSDDKYLKPVIADDPLLMLDIDDAQDLGQMERDEEHLDHQLKTILEDMRKRSIPMDAEAAAVVSSDKYYSESYARISIHHEMLTDTIRTEAYKEAIAKLASSGIKGKRVLDLGCGTAILSLFCATLGEAEAVVAVDASDIAYDAIDIVKENKLDHKIEVLKRKVEDLSSSSLAQFDVLISEWMGYFLLFEGMIDSVIFARDNLLRKGGLIMPNRCTMHLVAVQDEQKHDQSVKFWDDVYGFKMSCLRAPFIRDTSIEIVGSDKLISSPALIHSLDMNTCGAEDTEFETCFVLDINKSDAKCITSLVGYFDCHFDTINDSVLLSTSPLQKPTHWKQSVFYLREPLEVSCGDKLNCVIRVRRNRANSRHLHVDIEIEQRIKQSFSIE